MHQGTIILAAGGTGGHIFPAEALAEALLARGYRPVLVTDKRFHGYTQSDGVLRRIALETIAAGSLSGSALSKLKSLALLVVGCWQAHRIIRRIKPVAVVGFGGYPSFPTMVAAILLRRVTLLHEQNSVLGKVNRVLARFVNHIATSYAATQRMPASAAATLTGNPVRAAIGTLRTIDYPALTEDGMLRLLVTGGSQGASVFSEVVPNACQLLRPELRARIRVDQQVRAGEIDTVRARYQAMGMQADLAPFFADVAQRLAAAHLVIGRAGASTMAELMVAGRPAILVPLPSAADNHQHVNAQTIENSAAGWVIPQAVFSAQSLATRLETFLVTPLSLNDAAQAMRQLGLPDAAERLADCVLKIAGLAGVSPAKDTA